MVTWMVVLLSFLGLNEQTITINDGSTDTITTVQKDDTGGETGQVIPPKK